VSGAHIVVLSAFAVAQPLFYLFSSNAEFFAIRGSTPSDILVFALGILLIPPAVLLAVEGLAALVGERVWWLVHVVFMAGLFAIVFLQAEKRLAESAGVSLIVVAGLGGAAAALAYVSVNSVRSFLTVLTPAPLVFAALFLFDSPVSRLVFVDEGPAPTVAAFDARIPVVVLVFDELTTVSLLDAEGRIDAGRFPSFAALADDATFYRDATTVHAFTPHAVPAILTGRLPDEDELPVYADHRENLFTLLGSGYRLRVRETLTHLCPVSLCRPEETEPARTRLSSLASDSAIVYLHVLLPDSLSTGLPPVDRTWQDFRGKDTKAAARRKSGATFSPCAPVCVFERSITARDPGTLWFLHAQIPHVPWRTLPSGKRYVGDTHAIPGLDRHGAWTEDDFLVRQAYERYLLQLGYTDHALGVILARLRETGLYDRALVVVTADHGVGFEPGASRRNATPETLRDIAFMPLLVKLPGQHDARVEDGFVRTIDILPTIADALGIRVPWELDGRSLLHRRPAADGTVAVQGWGGKRYEAPLSGLLRERAEALRGWTALFGEGGWSGVYRGGPHAELVGRPLTGLDVETADGLRLDLDGRALLEDYDPRWPVSPAYVTGRVEGAASELDLAVAVNGRIATTTRTYEASGEVRFAAFVPEETLRSGRNDVEILTVPAAWPAGVLGELEPETLSLVAGEIRRSTGDVLRSSDEIRGSVGVTRERSRFVFGGWAADFEARAPVEALLVFVDGEPLYAARGVTLRGAFEPERHEGIDDTGFRFGLPRTLLPPFGSGHEVRVFAVSGDAAAELDYAPGYPWESR
jgi:hypothetical protein